MRSYLLLATGVVSVGAAAILIREAEAPALAVAFWRTLIGGAVLLAIVLATKRALPRGAHLARAVGAGALLAVHFWTWIESLALTSVAASVVLVCTQSIFVALLAFVFLGEKTPLVGALGIAIAFGGAVIIALDGESGPGSLTGDLLAIAGAVAIALYVLVGRKSAGRVDVLAYSATVALVAAAALALPLLLSAGPHVPPTTTSWLWVLALALGPQLIGHTALNAALARLPASVVSGSILGEPVIATALAWLFLGEHPGVLTIGGSLSVLVGVALLLRVRTVSPTSTA